MRLGVFLPTFRRSPDDALEAASRAAGAGLDGVFAYDHVWPMGSPERPALAPFEVLVAVATAHPTLHVGSLVARVGLVADHILLSQFASLQLVAGDRLIAGIGPGDSMSAAENHAYGVPLAGADARRRSLREVGTVLRARGAEVWIGDGAAATQAVARDLGCTQNLWQAAPSRVASVAAAGPVSWAGAAPTADDGVDERACTELLDALWRAGASWAVFTPSMDPDVLARLGDRLGGGGAQG